MDRQVPGHLSSEAHSKDFNLLAVSRPMLLLHGLEHASVTEARYGTTMVSRCSIPAALAESQPGTFRYATFCKICEASNGRCYA